jgi:serine/threonine-protein kinase
MSMDRERWRQVRDLFDRAMEQPAPERQRWVSAASSDDDDLAREVTSLLEALVSAGDRFEHPPLDGLEGHRGHEDPRSPAVGTRLGAYRLVRQIGRGGMGIVFEAERDDDQYRKRVAIKTISGSLDSELILRRFRHERQILARLEHRNIAGLLDGGVTEAGQPFLAMEFVEGDPIDRFAASRRLGIAERLQLFRQVCSAVQYAHQNLVIHRDLKPGNIFVAADGTVKLLDFGIAKLLDAPEDGVSLTQPGDVPVTTAYASPEQLSARPVTTAADVFALGVVLYELLAECHPFNHDRPGADEVRRRIRDDAPRFPSAAAANPQHARALRGDLDSIVLMALRKEPERRYSSVEQLGEDLRRYLEGRPVVARPDAVRYRFEKFVRRNRAAVAGAVLAVLALVLGLVATSWQASLARSERDRARASAASAERQRGRAEQASRFLQNMLGAADPSWYSATSRPGPETTIGDIFEEAGRRAEAELSGDPEVLADVLRTLGRANQALRRTGLAQRQLERAREIHLEVLGPASVDVAVDEHELGMVLMQQGDFTAAETWFRGALERFAAAHDSTSDEYGRTLADLGLVLSTSGRPAEAEPIIRAAAAHRKQFDSTSVANAILLGNLGLVLSQQGRIAEAEPYYREALAAFERFPDREYFEKGYTLGNLAVDLMLQGRTADALPLAEEQIAHFTRLLGPGHPSVGYGWVNLARILDATGEPARALPAARTADSIFRAALAADHPDIARSEAILGQIQASLGNLPEAERRLRIALTIRQSRLAPSSPHTADVAVALGTVLTQRGRYVEAESLLVAAEQTLRSAVGPENPRTVAARRELGRLRMLRGR